MAIEDEQVVGAGLMRIVQGFWNTCCEVKEHIQSKKRNDGSVVSE